VVSNAKSGASAAHMYVPATAERLIVSAGRCVVRTVILDLEDSVAPERKEEARGTAAGVLTLMSRTHRVWVRINSAECGQRDLDRLLPLNLAEGFWIPKAEPGQELDDSAERIQDAGAGLGLLIESAKGVHNLSDILDRHQDRGHGVWLQLGEVDLRADLGMAEGSSDTDRDLDSVRMSIVVAGVTFGVRDIVAPVMTQFTDPALVKYSSQHLAALGFTSRACIHPAQIDPIDQSFLPTADELDSARRRLEALEAAEASGVGSYLDNDGSMADTATVRRARRLLDG